MCLSFWFGLFLCCLLPLDLALAKAKPSPKQDVQTTADGGATRADIVVFNLYTRGSPKNPQNLQNSYGILKNNKPIKVVIHGWMGHEEKRFVTEMRDALLAAKDVNVITVDWSGAGAKNVMYPAVKNKLPAVAAAVADALDNVNRQAGIKLDRIHVLGYSLGAHIAGQAGLKVKTGKIGRITALDPAGPAFSLDKPYERLNQNSALFVDVIHTCGNFLGFKDSIGHADFFPNSGLFIQPGCGVDVRGACSHRRSWVFFIESLKNPKAFPAVTCPSWNNFKDKRQSCNLGQIAYMGEGLSNSARGAYYLETNNKAPYGKSRV